MTEFDALRFGSQYPRYPAGLPEVLQPVVPQIGDIWVWEPIDPKNSEVIYVTAVTWDSTECRVESMRVGGGQRLWNELGRWVEATVLLTPAEDTNCVICTHPKFEHIANQLEVETQQVMIGSTATVSEAVGFKGGCRLDWKRWPPGEDCGCPGYLAPKQ